MSVIQGNGQDNYLVGTASDDEIKANGGNDEAYGGAGNDTIRGGNGNDNLAGGSDNDLLLGGRGDDTLMGDDGNDTLKGGADNDTIKGGLGDDKLYGNNGDDTIIIDFGNDTVIGGDGADIFKFTEESQNANMGPVGVQINDFEDGVDKIDVTDFDVLNPPQDVYYDVARIQQGADLRAVFIEYTNTNTGWTYEVIADMTVKNMDYNDFTVDDFLI